MTASEIRLSKQRQARQGEMMPWSWWPRDSRGRWTRRSYYPEEFE